MPSSDSIPVEVDQLNPEDGHHTHSHIPNVHNLIHFIDEYAHHFAFSKQRTLYPRFDLEERETSYDLVGELPGCRKEDIHFHEVDGFGIKIEGTTLRVQLQDKNGHAQHVDVEPRNTHAPATTAWPDMAEPGMEAAFAAKEEAVIPAEKDNSGSSKPADNLENPSKKEAKTGAMKELTKPYPRTLFHERLVGNFQRTIRFPGPIDTKKVEAELSSGILRVKIPKDLEKEVELAEEMQRIDIAWAEAHMYGL